MLFDLLPLVFDFLNEVLLVVLPLLCLSLSPLVVHHRLGCLCAEALSPVFLPNGDFPLLLMVSANICLNVLDCLRKDSS